ncbi:MAG: hypothetical protein LBI18_02425 [Planctomycetaceae bacterium]|jgi:hypothetical protein|nr:hypothetical protein [Planctomycetaceae bacterium]
MLKNFIFVSVLLLCPWVVAETMLPWQVPNADIRQVFEVHVTTLSETASVVLPVKGNMVLENTEGSILFLDPAEPTKPLPYFKESDSFHVLLNGELSPKQAQQIVAYRGNNITASPILEKKPEKIDDYAAVQLRTPWNFENNKISEIISFGNSRDQYGNVTIENGWLKIPVLGHDAYFVYGDMWSSSEHPKNLKIDSSIYHFLEIRLKQSCNQAKWKFYVTDKNGIYQQHVFSVRGTEPQVFRFDLRKIFPNFWDGREFRALRIDPIKEQPNTVAEIDYIQILPKQPTIVSGHVFSRTDVEVRNQIQKIRVEVPPTVQAGNPTECSLSVLDRNDKPLTSLLPVLWVTKTIQTQIGKSKPDTKGHLKMTLPPIEQSGTSDWNVGIADDLGEPKFSVSGKINVTPNVLTKYQLSVKEFVDAQNDKPVTIEIVGVDRFSNKIPVNISQPKWTIDQGGSILSPEKPLRGETVSVSVRHSGKPLTTHHLQLTDENGISGTTHFTTVAYRKSTIRLNEHGYLISPDGSLFYPVGGFYANWPHAKPNADGTIQRSIDLFPCASIPYTHGFPWKEDVEKKVIEYLDHCQSHGVNTLRLMLRNMDIVGRVDSVQLQAVLHLFDLARPRGILFNIVLFEDYEKPPYYNRAILEKIVLPHYTPEELAKLPDYRKRFLVDNHVVESVFNRYSDADVIQCHKDYLKELIPILAGREEVLCYEFENEMHHFPQVWCQEIATFIRSIDPYTLILGNPDPMNWAKPLDWRNGNTDLIAFHTYNNGRPNADMGAVFFMKAKWTAQTKIPFSTGEGGVYHEHIPDETRYREQQVQAARDHIWMTFCAGGNGALYWTIIHENIIKEFGKIVPVIEALGIDLKMLKRRRPTVAIVMPTNGNANGNVTEIAKRLLELGVDFDTPPKGEDAEYAIRLDAMATKPKEIKLSESLRPTVAEPETGWDIATLVSDDEQSAVLYLRNIVGGIKNHNTDLRPYYFRNVQPSLVAFRLEQPERWKKIVVYELDSKTVKKIEPDKNGKIQLGITQSDYIIGLSNQ